MEERASTRWPSCARRNCRRIRSRVVCLCSAAGVERRSASWFMTGKGSGWRRSGYRKGGLCGGQAETSPRGCCRLVEVFHWPSECKSAAEAGDGSPVPSVTSYPGASSVVCPRVRHPPQVSFCRRSLLRGERRVIYHQPSV